MFLPSYKYEYHNEVDYRLFVFLQIYLNVIFIDLSTMKRLIICHLLVTTRPSASSPAKELKSTTARQLGY